MVTVPIYTSIILTRTRVLNAVYLKQACQMKPFFFLKKYVIIHELIGTDA